MVGGKEDVVESDIRLTVCKATFQRPTTLIIFPSLAVNSTHASHQPNISSPLMDDGHTFKLGKNDFVNVFIYANHLLRPSELKPFGIGGKVLN